MNEARVIRTIRRMMNEPDAQVARVMRQTIIEMITEIEYLRLYSVALDAQEML